MEYKKIIFFIIVIIGFSVMFMNGYDPLCITGLLFSTLLSYLLCVNKVIKLSYLDCSIIVLWLFELISHINSINTIQSISSLYIFSVSVFYYFIIRIQFNHKDDLKKLLFCYSVLFFIISLISIVSFNIFYNNVYSVGFDNLYEYRFLYRPLGFLTNVWGSLSICAIGVMFVAAFINNKSAKLVILVMTIPVIFSIIVSLSRGVYIAFILIILMSIYKLFANKLAVIVKIKYIFLSGIILVGLSYIVRNDIKRTFTGLETISQQRSIEGRIGAGAAAIEIFKEYPLLGVGTGNFSLAANQYLYENDKFAFFSSSIFFQLISEKGVVGIVLWLVFVVSIIHVCYRNKNDITNLNWAIPTLLLAIVVREVTHPLFFEYSFVQLGVFTLLVIMQNNNNVSIRLYPIKTKYIKFTPIIFGILFLAKGVNHSIDENNNNLAIFEVESNNLHKAATYIKRTSNTLPYLINRSIIYEKLFDSTKNTYFLDSAETALRLAIEKNQFDNQIKSNLAMVLYKKGNIYSANKTLSELSLKFKYNYTYLYLLSNINYYDDRSRCDIDLSNAIMLYPDILKSELYNNIKNSNIDLSVSIYNQIMDNTDMNSRDPIYNARFGKIMFLLNQNEAAKLLLTKAIIALPNLSQPWYLLAQIEYNNNNTDKAKEYLNRAKLLSPYDNNLKLLSYSENIKDHYSEYNIHEKYTVKFSRWYFSKIVK